MVPIYVRILRRATDMIEGFRPQGLDYPSLLGLFATSPAAVLFKLLFAGYTPSSGHLNTSACACLRLYFVSS
jgi:hypothetical protein